MHSTWTAETQCGHVGDVSKNVKKCKKNNEKKKIPVFETLIRLDNRFMTLHNNISDVLLYSIHSCPFDFACYVKQKLVSATV